MKEQKLNELEIIETGFEVIDLDVYQLEEINGAGNGVCGNNNKCTVKEKSIL